MNIDQLNRNNYKHKKTHKSSSSSETSSPRKTRPELNKADSNKKAANLTLSGSTFDSEITFTKKVLSNSRQGSLDSLKKIKQKINAGAYDHENVHKKISSLVGNDLSTLQQILSHSPETNTSPSRITETHKKQLLENSDVTQNIADHIARDLLNL